MRYAILSFTFAFWGLYAIAKSQAQNEPQKATSPQSGQQYFPIGVFEENGQLSSNKENWYSYFLTALGKPCERCMAHLPIFMSKLRRR